MRYNQWVEIAVQITEKPTDVGLNLSICTSESEELCHCRPTI